MTSLLPAGQVLVDALRSQPLFNQQGQRYDAYSYVFGQNNPDGSVTLLNTNGDHFSVPATFPVPVGFMVPPMFRNQGPYVGFTSNGAAVCITDCSGFVSYLVAQASVAAYSQLCTAAPTFGHPQPWPSAGNYATLTNTTAKPLPDWTVLATENSPVSDLAAAQPGDIFAYSISGAGDTGHVMVLTAPITQVGGTYEVPVLDESCIPHANDSGRSPSPYFGLGTGTVALRQSGGTWQACLNTQHLPLPDWFTPTAFRVLRVS